MLSTPAIDSPPLLAIDHLDVTFATPDGTVHAVQDVGFSLDAGESLGIVGESGAGKSQVFLAALGLLATNGSVAGSVRFRGEELIGLSRQALDRIREEIKDSEEVDELVRFIETSKRGIVK